MVPIPEANIDNHLKQVSMDMLHMLNNKLAIPKSNKDTKTTIINIAKLLNRDTLPPITDIAIDEVNNESTLRKVLTSEGDKMKKGTTG